MKKIYIIGKVSGCERKKVVEKFSKAERELEARGFIPVNPVRFIPEKTQWHRAMKTCILLLLQCDGIYLLPDWQDSKGGFLEFEIAYNLGMEVFYAMGASEATR